jgi:hypothetical protein
VGDMGGVNTSSAVVAVARIIMFMCSMVAMRDHLHSSCTPLVVW